MPTETVLVETSADSESDADMSAIAATDAELQSELDALLQDEESPLESIKEGLSGAWEKGKEAVSDAMSGDFAGAKEAAGEAIEAGKEAIEGAKDIVDFATTDGACALELAHCSALRCSRSVCLSSTNLSLCFAL